MRTFPLAGLLLALIASPAAAQECRTASPQASGSLSEHLTDAGVRLIEASWTPSWERTVGMIVPADPARPNPELRDTYVRLWSLAAPEEEVEALAEGLKAELRAPDLDASVSFFLSADRELTPFVVDGFAYCAPQMRNGATLAEELGRRGRDLELDTSAQTRVAVLVNAQGTVARARVQESSGSDQVDAAALEIARLGRFNPGTVEGIPMWQWATLPVTFRMG